MSSLRLEGSILSSDLLDSIERGEKHSQEAKDFGLTTGTKVKDEIASAWAAAKAYWTAYQAKTADLKPGVTGTTETRNLFVQPLLSLLGYSPQLAEAELIQSRTYAISHRDSSRDGFPIHIIGPYHADPKIDPDKSSLDIKVKGMARISPHALVQEYLNLTEHLYALVCNGHKLRLLRDSSRLVKLSFIEFDFERMFTEELFSDFALLFRLLHASRMPANRDSASESIIERYHQDALDSGSRIRDGLAAAVAYAMQSVANGLLAHPDNDALREELLASPDAVESLHENLVRWVYRTLFLLVIEERGLHHHPDATLRQRQIYRDFYSIQRLRKLADRPKLADSRHHDLWRSMYQSLRLYESAGRGRPLGIEPLGSFLFESEGLETLFRHQLDNRSFLQAFQRLSVFTHPDTRQRMRVNYAALDVEEFGSVYESLLELRPALLHGDGTATYAYVQLSGNERKTTGSYYTPHSLVQQLITTALDPVIDRKLQEAKNLQPSSSNLHPSEQALLSLRVCDPAVGSGHFLIAAAHRIAQRLAEVRAGDEALSPDVQREALRDVVSHCLYGVDINPLSVELCKVSLWMLAMQPGKPLSFLDHHIKLGNSLLGTTPEAIADGIPDDAFKPILGDDKKFCSQYKKANRDEWKNRRQSDLFDREMKPWDQLGNLPAAIASLDTMPDDTPEAVQKKREAYAKAVASSGYLNSRLLHDAWCAAFVWKKSPPPSGFDYPVTNAELLKIQRKPHSCPHWMREEIQRLAAEYRFFPWHLEFPEVFAPVKNAEADNAQSCGFDVMLGNPPWERVKLQEKEWFATRNEKIANAPNAAARKSLIRALEEQNPHLRRQFHQALRIAEGNSHLLRDSGIYPLCGRGDVNLYTVFAELFRNRLSPSGLFGAVLPSGIASDDTTKFYFQDLVEKRSLVSFYDFENKGLFPAVDSRMKFCLLTAGSGIKPSAEAADFAFFCHSVDDLQEPGRRFTLSPEDIELLNPNTRTCPIFRSTADAELTKAIYRRVPVLIREARDGQPEQNPWGITFSTMFHMSNDSHLFRTREDLEADGYTLHGNIFRKLREEEYLPLYEGRMVDHFDHRYASVGVNEVNTFRSGVTLDTTVGQHKEAGYHVLPRYWVNHSNTESAKPADVSKKWVFGFKDITSATNERTFIGSVLPFHAVGNKVPLILSATAIAKRAGGLAALSSFVFDFIVKQKVGGVTLNFF